MVVTGTPMPAWLEAKIRELPPEDRDDFADELREREAIMGEYNSDAWRAAFLRVVERRNNRRQ
jgi:hypothetical protein